MNPGGIADREVAGRAVAGRAVPAPGRQHVLALLAVVFAAYAPSLANGFALDDPALARSVLPVTGAPNPAIAGFHSPLYYFTHHYWHPVMENDGLFRPVTVWSFALVYQLVGQWLPSSAEASPQHLVNILLHLWATWLVLRLVAGLGLAAPWSLLTAALFGLHAIHSEAVISIVGRAELFAFCFGASALLAFCRPGVRPAIAAGAWLFLAISSKESALAWVAMLPCYLLAAAWRRDPTAAGWRILQTSGGRLLAVMVGATAAWLPFWLGIQATAHHRLPPFAANDLAHLPDLTRILTAIEIWGFGLYKCVVPLSLSCLYGPAVFPVVQSPWDAGVITAAAALLAILAGGLLYAKRAPLALVAMAWFLGFGMPTANLLFPIGTSFAERLFYTPSLGVCLLPALIFARRAAAPPRILRWLVAAWLLVNATVIVQRDLVWRDDATLFLHDVAVRPRSIDLNRKAASVLASGPRADLAAARRHLETAVALQPEDCLSWKDLGDLESRAQRWQPAIANYRKVLQSRYLESAGDAAALAQIGIGNAWLGLRDPDQAQTAFRRSIEAQPANPMAHVGIGRVHLQRGDVRSAVASFRQALSIRPDDRDAWLELSSYAADTLPPAEIQALFDDGLRRFARDPEMSILVGGMGYHANLDSRRVATVLADSIARLPPNAQRDFNVYTARLFLAATHERLGQIDKAVIGYRLLAGDQGCPPEVRRAAMERLAQGQEPK